jgi:hypothetical protein
MPGTASSRNDQFMKINILSIILLLSTVSAFAFIAKGRQSLLPKPTTKLSGTVMDMNDSLVSGATVTVEGEGLKQAVATSEDGTYEIGLPAGTYRIKVARTGFCPAHRAPFRAQSSASIIINFILIPCSIENDITIKDGQYVGETDRYRDPFKEEVFPPVHRTGLPLELLVRYGSRQQDQNIVEYRGTSVGYDEHADTPAGSVRREKYLGVTVNYDLLMIRADKVRLDPTTFQLEADGNVVVEDGRRCVKGRRVVVDLKTDGFTSSN